MAKKIGLFETFFYGTLGSMTAFIMVGIFSFLFFVSGYSLIKKYNKEGTKPFEDLQPEQYLGVVLCMIGITPWIRYFIIGFGLEAGEKFFNELFE
tara:strand:- start:1886 stop:2170 length:285 start_codon:yes stop_codon:yes gene_type:complete